VSLYPTLAGSARAGAQALLGLALGIVLGLGGIVLLSAGVPGVIAVAAVVGIGIIIGGIDVLGTGRDWVAIAALFVLLIGHTGPDEFSLSYLLTMTFGVLVGILANLIAPPLYLRRASTRLSTLRDAVAASLHAVADRLMADSVAPEDVTGATRGLETMLATVEQEVREAEQSSRANPRSRRRGADRALNERRLQALARTTRISGDLADGLARAAERDSLDAATRELLVDAIHATADLVAAPVGDTAAADRLAAASSALDRVVQTLDRDAVSTGSQRAHAYAAVMCVSRIIDASRDFVDRD
jgi:uncharacterized membrane protein YgaE (UPF0421/DUF939 family)